MADEAQPIVKATVARPTSFCEDCAEHDPNYKPGDICKHMLTGVVVDAEHPAAPAEIATDEAAPVAPKE